MNHFGALFSAIYLFFSRRRIVLGLSTLVSVGGALFLASQIEINENIKSMIPDQEQGIYSDFNLIQHMPFARQIIINLNAEPEVGIKDLFKAADSLILSMTPPYFSRVVSGPDIRISKDLYFWILANLPNLTGEKDIETFKRILTPSFLKERLREIYSKLVSPEGVVLKELLQNDPLNLSAFFYEKFRHTSPTPQLRLVENHFLSPDGRNTLIIAETPVENTDFREGKNLQNLLEILIRKHIPQNIHASFISPHRYAVSNAERINADIWIVLSASSILLFIIFFLFMRNVRALLVYLVPFCCLGFASAGTALFFRKISAITIGFGAVLLGISVDYAVHVYFALRRTDTTPDHIIGGISRPILFSAFTTLAAFAVLLFSDLPGQREIAVFTIIGILFSLSLSLVVLPQIIRSNRDHASFPGYIFKIPSPNGCKWILFGWIAILTFCFWGTTKLSFDGDLRVFNFVPKSVQADEIQLKKIWGDVTKSSMICIHQHDIESALHQNELLFAALSDRFPNEHLISLSPILPSSATQSVNRERWKEFWFNGEGKTILADFKNEMISMGFSHNAFSPFFNRLTITPDPILPELLRSQGFGSLIDAFLIQTETGNLIATLVPDIEDIKAFSVQLQNTIPGIRVISQSRFHEVIGKAIGKDFIRFLLLASCVVFIIVSILFRNRIQIFLSLVPITSGLIIMTGVMGVAGIPFNMFNIIATILIIGLGVDYGLFMVCHLTESYEHHTEEAILVCGLTTLAGFGALILAKHPALQSIGMTVLIGIGAAIPAALWVIPSIYFFISKEKKPEF